ncbi:MAG: YgiQ family radical SAM protein [Bacteroidales bacterium]|nr:YgiQ family radical SAM protein [Bacteroidales bacterium]MBN2756975.1 YgiQ family radical SAM protein [Bacteroidales bacterium]
MKSDKKFTHLPTTAKEVKERGWDYIDVILFSGDAYIDHPSFGIAVIGRVLENLDLKVAIIPQPNWQDDLRDFKKLGKPRLFFGVSAGNMDSMVNHYTANKRLRSNDAYTAGGQSGFRPDYATIVYSNILKNIYPDVPLIIGGVEASLRRLTHYDYWSNTLKQSILAESKADLLVYGMGEKAITEIALNLKAGKKINELININQTAYIADLKEITNNKSENTIKLHSHEECLKSKKKFAENFKHIEEESNKKLAKILVQQIGNQVVIVNPPNDILPEKELNKIFNLPYSRLPHPKYQKKGAIPAFDMIKFSINIHRGCFGGCSFCTISAHQGKFIQSRSEKSILEEVKQITKMPDFKGYISDLGGPSANMYKMEGFDLSICEKCKRPSCIFPNICNNLNTSHKELNNIYNKAEKIEGIKKIFIGSGIRYDLLFDKNDEIKGNKLEYTKNLIQNHVSGRLKVAPEHTSDAVLKMMRKPSFKFFKKFNSIFEKINKSANLNQQLIPYFISSHPASQITDMAELAYETKELDFKLEQVQDFTPTPMTLSTVIYYSGYHPFTMEKVYTARNKDEKLNQRLFFFWYKKEFRKKIENKLSNIGRMDLLKKLIK